MHDFTGLTAVDRGANMTSQATPLLTLDKNDITDLAAIDPGDNMTSQTSPLFTLVTT